MASTAAARSRSQSISTRSFLPLYVGLAIGRGGEELAGDHAVDRAQVDAELVGEAEEERGEQRARRAPPAEDQRGQRDEALAADHVLGERVERQGVRGTT